MPKGATLKPSKVPKINPRAKTSPKAKAAKAGLTFTQAARLKALPDEIEDLEKKVTALETKLADPGLYTDDPERFRQITRAHETLQVALAAAEQEWLELEMLNT